MRISRYPSVVIALLAFGTVASAQNPITGPMDAPRKARIGGAIAELARCDADKTCYLRPLLQARLNALLKIDKTLDDFEKATIPYLVSDYSKLAVPAPPISLTGPVNKEALRGKMAMSVYVSGYGDDGIPGAEMRLSLEQELHLLGITVLRHGDPPNFPVLNLVINVERPDSQTVIYTCSMELRQLAPGANPAARPINDAAIWKLETVRKSVFSGYAWNSPDDALQLAATFAGAWRDVNGRHDPTSDKPMQPLSLGALSSDPGPPLHFPPLSCPANGSKDGGCIQVVDQGVTNSIYDVADMQRDLVQKELLDLQGTGQKVITCEYGPTHPETGLGFFVYHFWYPSAPPNILGLLTSAYSHPLLELGRVGLGACPATKAKADDVYRNRIS